METEKLIPEQEITQPEEYSTNPDKDDARYIFDWDEFIAVQKPEDSPDDDNHSKMFCVI